jgi:2-polyprenyl-3-methyl-5-hydroxy-6-metoxy-1,4-benzoquinol methylase
LRGLPKKNLVADLGCFGGVIFPYLKSAGCRRIEGFDIDKNSLKAASTVYDKVYRWDAEREKVPVESERYDVVIAAEIVEHLLDVDHFLTECWRVISKGGFLLVTTPNLVSLYNRLRVLLGKMPFNAPSVSWKHCGTETDPAHVKIANASEWTLAFRGHGFQVTDFRGVSSYRLLNPIDSLRPTLSGTLVFTLRKT